MNYDKKVSLISELQTRTSNLDFRDDVELKVLKSKIKLVLENIFPGSDCSEYLGDIDNARFYPMAIFGERDIGNEMKSWEKGKQSILAVLTAALERITFENEMLLDSDSKIADVKDYVVTDITSDSSPLNNKIFIVHGRDDAMKLTVKDFIQSIGLEPIILHEQIDKSQTVIEKFLSESEDIEFAIVLFSPDDIGKLNEQGEKFEGRARQNVVLEYGFFVGKLGRENTYALVKNGTVLPNDMSGLIYNNFSGEWKLSLMRLLSSKGYKVDMKNLLK